MAPDKILHLKAGAAAALFGLAIGLLAVLAGIVPATSLVLGPPIASLTAGLTKEKADDMDNDMARAQGMPELHGVSVGDAAATAAPGLLLAVAIYAAMPWLVRLLGAA